MPSVDTNNTNSIYGMTKPRLTSSKLYGKDKFPVIQVIGIPKGSLAAGVVEDGSSSHPKIE